MQLRLTIGPNATIEWSGEALAGLRRAHPTQDHHVTRRLTGEEK
jgi:hypothetical protein